MRFLKTRKNGSKKSFEKFAQKRTKTPLQSAGKCRLKNLKKAAQKRDVYRRRKTAKKCKQKRAYSTAAKRLKKSDKKAKVFKSVYKKTTQEITQSPHGKFSVFTVKNYSEYQGDNTTANNQVTQNQHSANTDPYIKKSRSQEIKNIK